MDDQPLYERQPLEELSDIWVKLRDIQWIPEGRIESQLINSHALLIVKHGEGSLMVDLRPYRMRQDVVHLLLPGQTFAVHSEGSEGFALYMVRFDVWNEQHEVGGTFPVYGEIPIVPEAETGQRCESLLHYWIDEQPLERFRAQSAFQEWLYWMLKPIRQKSTVDSRSALERTKTYIDQHYNESLTIEQLARMANLSSKYYVDLFKKTYGLSTIDYVTEVRLNHAKKQMTQSDARLSLIAHQVGYQDEFYFSRKFKQAMGVSPSAYMKNRRRKLAAYMPSVVGHLLPLNLIPYAAPLHPKWTSYYYRAYRSDIPLHLSAYRFNHDWQANISLLTESSPDLIITLDMLQPEEREQLARIAPLLVIEAKETDWREQLRLTAQFVNASSDAESWLMQYERKLKRVRERIKKEIEDDSILVISLFKQQCYFCPTRGMKELLIEDLQLNVKGLSEAVRFKQPLTEEQIATIDADHILLNICQESESLKYWQSLQSSALWQDLKAVRRNQVYAIASDPWREYSAHACDRMLDDLVIRLCGDRPE